MDHFLFVFGLLKAHSSLLSTLPLMVSYCTSDSLSFTLPTWVIGIHTVLTINGTLKSLRCFLSSFAILIYFHVFTKVFQHLSLIKILFLKQSHVSKVFSFLNTHFYFFKYLRWNFFFLFDKRRSRARAMCIYVANSTNTCAFIIYRFWS